jgi:sarcosine oxidase
MAYYEHPSYVPLLKRAYENWNQLQLECKEELFIKTGSIDASPHDHSVFLNSKLSCETYNLDHQILTSKELSQKYPGYELPEDYMALYQPDGGILLSERCVVASVNEAIKLGAEIHGKEEVLSYQKIGEYYHVMTSKNEYSCEKIVLTTGAWMRKTFSKLENLLTPERQVVGWFQPKDPSLFQLENFPVFNIAIKENEEISRIYGFPICKVPGFKIGVYHHLNEIVDLKKGVESPNENDENLLSHFTKKYFPKAFGPTMSLSECMFVCFFFV